MAEITTAPKAEKRPEHYRVEAGDGDPGCPACGHGKPFTIVEGHGDDEMGVGTSWEDKELADDICELMNQAFSRGLEAAADTLTAQEELTELAPEFPGRNHGNLC